MSMLSSEERSLTKKTLYRTFITLVLPIAWLWLLIGLLIQAAPEYWDELKDLYRMFPKAFRKGSPI